MKTKNEDDEILEKQKREHRCRKAKCQHKCEYGNKLQRRDVQRQYIMPYIRGYERIHGLNKFAVYGWNNEGQNITTEIKLGKVTIKKWERLEEPLD